MNMSWSKFLSPNSLWTMTHIFSEIQHIFGVAKKNARYKLYFCPGRLNTEFCRIFCFVVILLVCFCHLFYKAKKIQCLISGNQ